MRLNLSNSSKPIRRRRSVTQVVSGNNGYLVMGEQSKLPIWKRSPCDTLSIDSKLLEMADLDCWRQQGRKFGVDLLKKNLTKIGKVSMGQKTANVATTGLAGGRQQLTIRKRRRSIHQHRKQQQARRYSALHKQSQCSLDLMDADQISQWSVPLAVTGISSDEDRLESNIFAGHSHSSPLMRSHSQQNFCDCDETEIYCYETAPIELTTADNSDHDFQGNVSNVEPHLNYYVENCRGSQIRDDLKNPHSRANGIEQDGNNEDYSNGISQNYIKDEDNLFDNLCHSGCLCSENQDKSEKPQDLLRCAEIQKSEITAKAFQVYVDYYATQCDAKIQNGDDISTQARDKWQSLSQKEKLPFLLQAYISDYMPKN